MIARCSTSCRARTIRVHDARVTVQAGTYSEAAETWAAERRSQEDAHHRAKDKVRATAARLATRAASTTRPIARGAPGSA